MDSLESNITVLSAAIQALENNGTYPQILAKLASLNQSQIRLQYTTKRLSSSIEAVNYTLSAADTELWNKTTDIEQTTHHLENSIASLADDLRSEITSTADELRSSIDIVAETTDQLSSNVSAAITEFTADIEQTTQYLQNSIAGVENDLKSEITSKVSGLRSSIDTMTTNLDELQASTGAAEAKLIADINEIKHQLAANQAEVPIAKPVLTVSMALIYFILYWPLLEWKMTIAYALLHISCSMH